MRASGRSMQWHAGPESWKAEGWCGRRDLNPQAFWAPAPKAGVFAISPLPRGAAQAGPRLLKSRVKAIRVAMRSTSPGKACQLR